MVDLAVRVYSLMIQTRRMINKIEKTLAKLEEAMTPEQFLQYQMATNVLERNEGSHG